MATVTSVALTQPSTDPNIGTGQTFTIGGQITKALHGGLDYGLKFQWDQGTSTWADIPTSGADLTVDAQPATNLGDEAEYTGTVTANTAGSYSVRAQTVDNNDAGALDTSGTQAVTVTLGAIAGDGAYTQDDQTISATGTQVLGGDGAFTQDGHTVAATGTSLIKGAGVYVQDAQTIAATGTVGDPTITGNGAFTQDSQTIVATGTVSGDSAGPKSNFLWGCTNPVNGVILPMSGSNM